MAEADEGAVVCGAGCGGDRSSGVLAAETADEATGGLQGPNLADEAGHGALGQDWRAGTDFAFDDFS